MARLPSAVGLLLLVSGGWMLQTALSRPGPPTPSERAVAYGINRRNFAANCEGVDAGGSAVLTQFCADAARLLADQPECDPACRDAIAGFRASPAAR